MHLLIKPGDPLRFLGMRLLTQYHGTNEETLKLFQKFAEFDWPHAAWMHLSFRMLQLCDVEWSATEPRAKPRAKPRVKPRCVMQRNKRLKSVAPLSLLRQMDALLHACRSARSSSCSLQVVCTLKGNRCLHPKRRAMSESGGAWWCRFLRSASRSADGLPFPTQHVHEKRHGSRNG